MSIRRSKMKSTINPALVNLLRQDYPEVELRLEAQEAALQEIACPTQSLAAESLIAVEELLSSLDLDDISLQNDFPQSHTWGTSDGSE